MGILLNLIKNNNNRKPCLFIGRPDKIFLKFHAARRQF